MNIDAVTQYVISIAPAATACASIVAAVIVGVLKVRGAIKNSGAEYQKTAKDINSRLSGIEEEQRKLTRENGELKRENALLKKKLLHLHFEEEPDGKK